MCGRRAVGVERFDGLQPPGLTLFPVRLVPADRFPVGGEDQTGTCIGQFHPVARRFPDIKKERPLNRVLVRAGLDVDTGLQE